MIQQIQQIQQIHQQIKHRSPPMLPAIKRRNAVDLSNSLNILPSINKYNINIPKLHNSSIQEHKINHPHLTKKIYLCHIHGAKMI